MRSFKLACPFCGEIALISQSWLEKNDRVGCMNCNKSWEVSPDEMDLSQPDFFEYTPEMEDESTEVLDEFVREYLGEYYDEIADMTKKSKKHL